MALKKSELYSSLWSSCDELRGGMDASQEKDAVTSGLARMNMILHNNPTALIKQGNTLANPLFTGTDGQLKTFDFVVANPPFSDKRWSTGIDPLNDPHERFKHFGTPPAKQGDYAYLLHIVRSLKSSGKGACILPHGVLFRGNAEADIRRNLVRKGYIKGIIGLPSNLFYGTGIPACIIVIDKENAHTRKGIFMIDASGGYLKDGNKNRLRDMDLHKIVDVFTKGLEVPKYSRMVGALEIEKNDFNLNIPRYIDSQQAEDLQDIEGHLRGGIPTVDVDDLQPYWDVCPQLRKTLFSPRPLGEGPGVRDGYLDLAVPKQAIKPTIYGHPEFVTFIKRMNALFADWRSQTADTLKALQAGCHPKNVINELAEDLLSHYTGKPLIDKYDVYQHLIDYWAETMQDDCYLVAADGWKAETYRILVENKQKKMVDKGWTCDLIPKHLVVARYFKAEQEVIVKLDADLESIAAQMAELEEEHSGEEGAFSELDKVNKANVTVRLKEIKGDREAREEATALAAWLKLSNQESDLKKALKEAEATLDALAYGKYPQLTEAEIKTLVVDDKWLAALDAAIHGEMDRISQVLTRRLKVLAERYETPQPEMVERVAELEAKVSGHLASMGYPLNAGAMQDLISGKVRLPGFSGEWRSRQLGEVIAHCSSGATPYRGRPDFYKGDVKWITSGKLNYNVITDTIEHISKEAVEKTNLKIHPAGTFLIAITGLEAAGIRGSCGIVGSPATTNQSCMAIYPTEELTTDYLYHYYVLRGSELALRFCQGTKQQSYTAKLVRLLPIDLPPTIEEQTAIATILSDMDAEITALENKLAKTRQLKLGMMQELLTGKIRLVDPVAKENHLSSLITPKPDKPHNWAFNEAVVISVLAEQFGKPDFPLGRKRYTKLAYLMHRKAEQAADGYLKKAAGPYNPKTKYAGPEKIALENGYIRECQNGNFKGFVAAGKIEQAKVYFSKRYDAEIATWLEQFRYKSNDELECLATVDMAMQELLRQSKAVNVDSVRILIASEPEWLPKLERAVFSDDNIERAIQTCRELFI